jgi:hypothetical protein
MTSEQLAGIIRPFPGTIVPKVGTQLYIEWRGHMALWAYANGPALLDAARELVAIKEFLKK